MVYEWRLGPRQFSVEAQTVGETLEQLRIRCNGHLTPRAVVDDAKAPDSPIHPIFEWNDARAAEAHRESQASELMRMIVVRLPEQRGDAEPVRAFVSVRVEQEPFYTSVQIALGDDGLRQQLLAQATRELVAIRKRYTQLEELADLFVKIDRLAELRESGELQ
jgi:hypothetical protein